MFLALKRGMPLTKELNAGNARSEPEVEPALRAGWFVGLASRATAVSSNPLGEPVPPFLQRHGDDLKLVPFPDSPEPHFRRAHAKTQLLTNRPEENSPIATVVEASGTALT